MTHGTQQAPHIDAYMKVMQTMHDDMMAASQISDADIAFMKGMIPHHQAAIDMAKIELQYGQDEQIKTLANAVIQAQQAEIEQMNQWLAKHPVKATDAQPTNTMPPSMDMSLHQQMMDGVMDTNPDKAFVKGMIPHHQGAINMADIAPKNAKDDTVLKLAKAIKDAQTPEIAQMQAWLKAHPTSAQ